MNAASPSEVGGLAVKDDLRHPLIRAPYFDGAPRRNVLTNAENLHDRFFCSKAFGKSRGSGGTIATGLHFLISEEKTSIAIAKSNERGFDLVDGLYVDSDDNTFLHRRMLLGG